MAQNLGQDDGHFSRAEDEAIGEKARAKRASNAGAAAGRGRKDAPDPVLPEKKRARRRLVGAIALALAAAIGIPMLLDSEPKPLNGDIAIQIPSKETAAPLPVPAAPAPVDAADTLDKREEIVTAPARVEPPRKVSKYDTELRDEPAPVKVEPKPEPKVAKVEKVEKLDKPVKPDKPKPLKPDEKHDVHPLAAKSTDSSRALAILEDKQDKPARVAHEPVDSASQRYVLQVVALASQEKVTELQARLAGAGLRSYTEKSTASSGASVIRVRVGPFGKDEAEKTRAKLSAMGLPGTMVPAK
ncbi:SPOR domain-containing protein [Massilia sp. S19_KUP03_FR1]|uniref:SPOR domain-containing protein n=1 Tax=Massilia sp. S19_KUP03_FR1 TaxID=3025503 RepID=UPI002FCD31B1